MANTYTQIHIQMVFAVKFRDALITKELKPIVHGYLGKCINSFDHKTLIINGMPDHVHCLIGMRPTQSLSTLMQEIKAHSSKMINDRRLIPHRFEWQEGYGAFSYSKSQVPAVADYIARQEEHHRVKTFREEYLEFLRKAEIEYDERYIFKDLI
jgi:putative transposase